MEQKATFLEISSTLTTVCVLVHFRRCFCSYKRKDITATTTNPEAQAATKKWRPYMGSFFVDFLFIVLAPLLLSTILSACIYTLGILSIVLLAILMAVKRFYSSSQYSEGRSISFRTEISSFRVSMMTMTCLCILAVDFRIFPKYYGKSSKYGNSLMDLGVGSFVVANAIVSRQARNYSKMTWKGVLRSGGPMILLGLIRLVATTAVGYGIHVTAYGVHWNFFFTLGAVGFLISIFNVPPKFSGILGSAILIGYQTWLSNGFNQYLLSYTRGPDLISQNKEGIFSVIGYWGMYLVGVQLGHYLFFQNNSSGQPKSRKWGRIRVYVLTLLFWILALILDKHVEEVSRRMCNLSYVTWIWAQNLQVLAIFMLSDYIPGSEFTQLEEALNKNLLASFLVANILTGLTNLLMNTRAASSMLALSILSLYAFVVSSTIAIVNLYGIRGESKTHTTKVIPM
ncbi:hypothetical protein ACFE04_022703 [Oxalis oulophora]